MDRIRNLNTYPKVLLLVLVAMAVVFCSVYTVVTAQEGYLYRDRILVPGTENGSTTYSAEVKGEQWCFIVTPDKSVTFRCGNKQYGPYTAKIDSTAIPKEHVVASAMTGVELREDGEVLFRGGVYDKGTFLMMVSEDGTDVNFGTSAELSNGTVINGNNEVVDPMEPSASTILRLMEGPKLTHKGQGVFCFLGLFISLVAVVYILFADELFRLKFVFHVRNSEDIEPSDLELGMRPICWTVMVASALIAYIMGLR